MPIQIIDNFDLNALKPLDNRLVVGPTPSFYHNKDDIPNKYIGLRVWELPGAELGSGVINTTIAGLAYVYTGSAWVSENTTSIGGGASLQSVSNLQQLPIPYFNSPNSILDSDMYYNFADNNFGISSPPDQGLSSLVNNIAKLKVNGNVVISGKYVGDAGGADGGVNIFGITNINGSNIIFGTMDVQRLGGSSNVGWILTSDNISSASYKVPSSINVGSATQLQNPRLIYGNSFNGTANVTGNITFGTQLAKATIVYNQNQTVNLNVPSISGSGIQNRTFALLEQATQTFTGAVIMGYVGTLVNDPPGFQVSGTTVLVGNVTTNLVNTNGAFTVTHTDPAGGTGTVTKFKISEGTGQYWVTFGSDTLNSAGNQNAPRIRTANGAVTIPSYTWRGDMTTGMYRPAAGIIGFTSVGVEKMRISSGVEISSPCVISDSLSIGTVGTTIGTAGTTFKRITSGTIRVHADGSIADIIRGTGFTVVANTGSLPANGSTNTPVVTVTLTGAVGSDIIVVSAMDGSVNYYKWGCASEKVNSSSFKIVVSYDDMSGGSGPNLFSGTVLVSFICVCI